jgi:hypothetical protein
MVIMVKPVNGAGQAEVVASGGANTPLLWQDLMSIRQHPDYLAELKKLVPEYPGVQAIVRMIVQRKGDVVVYIDETAQSWN